MSIKGAMKDFFDRQAAKSMEKHGLLPMIPYQHERKTLIYKGQRDEEDWIQWKPIHAKTIKMDQLCPELVQLYSSYYYGQMEGLFDGITYDFPPIYNEKDALHQAKWALMNGQDLFPDENAAVIAICEENNADRLLLVYEQSTNKLFVWDDEDNDRKYLDVSLEELITNIEPSV